MALLIVEPSAEQELKATATSQAAAVTNSATTAVPVPAADFAAPLLDTIAEASGETE